LTTFNINLEECCGK